MASEARLQRKIQAALNALPDTFVFKHHGGPYSYVGASDLMGCSAGRAVFLEVKVPGGKATAAQERFLARMARCGAMTGVVTSVDEAKALLL